MGEEHRPRPGVRPERFPEPLGSGGLAQGRVETPGFEPERFGHPEEAVGELAAAEAEHRVAR